VKTIRILRTIAAVCSSITRAARALRDHRPRAPTRDRLARRVDRCHAAYTGTTDVAGYDAAFID
jgi:hypothetical protein